MEAFQNLCVEMLHSKFPCMFSTLEFFNKTSVELTTKYSRRVQGSRFRVQGLVTKSSLLLRILACLPPGTRAGTGCHRRLRALPSPASLPATEIPSNASQSNDLACLL